METNAAINEEENKIDTSKYDRILATAVSSSVQEIISTDPGFIIRWGISIIFLVVLVLIASSWFIKYPDIVSCSARLTTINAPKPLVTKQSGKLVKLIIADGQTVKQGDVIGYLESAENADSVLRLEKQANFLNSCLTRKDSLRYIYEPDVRISLAGGTGKLKSSYESFLQAYVSFMEYMNNGVFIQKRNMLEAELGNLKRNHNSLVQTKELHAQDIALTRSELKEKEKDAKEYRDLSSKLIAKELSIPQTDVAIVNNENQQNEKRRIILEMDNVIASQVLVFRQSLNSVLSDIQEWKQNFLLTAPTSGKLNITSFLQESQLLQANQTLGYVIPSNSSHYMQIMIPQNNFGKVDTGQKVLIKFNSYKWQEYGAVEGRIEYISPMPTDTIGYMAKVKLPTNLITNHDQIIPYREGLMAHAEIITKDKRMLEKLLMVLRIGS